MPLTTHNLGRALLDLLGAPFEFIGNALSIITSRRLLLPCLVPWLVGTIAFGIAVANLDRVAGWGVTALGTEASAWLSSLVSVLGWGIGLLGAALIAVVAAVLLGGVCFDFMVEELLRREHLLDEQERPLAERVRLVARGLRDDLAQIAVLGALGTMTLIVGFFPPLLALGFLLSALSVGYGLIDKPLALMGLRLRHRLNLARAHLFEVVALGAFAAPIVLLPVVNFIALPVLYATAVRRVVRWRVAGPVAGDERGKFPAGPRRESS
jgi:uncharacterized protein involved in cysteine biosynthesis